MIFVCVLIFAFEPCFPRHAFSHYDHLPSIIKMARRCNRRAGSDAQNEGLWNRRGQRMTAWASRADVVAHPQEREELGSNILRAPGKLAGGSRCKFCTLKI